MKKFSKAILYTLIILIAFVIVALLVAPRFIPTDVYKKQIEKIVTDKSGMELDIKGDLSFSFFPRIKANIGDVFLKNADQQDFVSFKTANINLKLFPLLKKKIEVSNFKIENLMVNLGNSKSLAFDYLENKINMEAPDRMLSVVGGFKINGQVFAHNIELNSLQNVLNKEIANLKFILNSSVFDLSYSGNVLLADNISTDARLEIDAKSIQKLAKVFENVVAIDIGSLPESLKLSTDLSLKDNILETKKNIIVIFKNGEIIETDNSFKVNYGEKIPNIVASINVTNNVKVNAFLPKARSKPEEKVSGGEVVTVKNTEIETFENEKTPFIWSKEKIDFSPLKTVDADVSLKTKGILYDSIEIDNTDIQAKLGSGNLQATINKIELYNGNIQGTLGVDSAKEIPSVKANFNVNNLTTDDIIKNLVKSDRFGGILNAKINVNAQGDNIDKMINTLNGNGNIEVQDGTLRGIDLQEVISNLKTNPAIVLDLWKNQPDNGTQITELNVPFTITNGLVNTPNIAIALPYSKINGSGTTNLPTYAINYRFIPQITKDMEGGDDILGGIEIPVTFTGTFNDGNIKYGVDLNAAAQSAAKKTIDKETEKLKERAKSKLFKELDIKGNDNGSAKDAIDGLFKKF